MAGYFGVPLFFSGQNDYHEAVPSYLFEFSHMDRYSRSIILSLITVLGLTLLAVIAAWFLPFEVTESGILQQVTGVAELYTQDELPATPTGETELTVGETLRIQPGGITTIVFKLNQGRAIVTGPATLRLVESYRRATALGHTLDSDRFKREYALTLEQTSGSVRYLFSDTTPSFEDMLILIRLPDGTYTPKTPCWNIDISIEGYVTTTEIDCSS